MRARSFVKSHISWPINGRTLAYRHKNLQFLRNDVIKTFLLATVAWGFDLNFVRLFENADFFLSILFIWNTMAIGNVYNKCFWTVLFSEFEPI